MTRVLIIEPAGGLWGSERALLDLVGVKTDAEIAVCCPPRTSLCTELAARGVRCLPYFVAELHLKSIWARLWAALGVVRACLAFRPQVLHLNQSGAYRIIQPAARLFGLPIVGHVRIFEDAGYLARQAPNPRRLRAVIAISGAVEAGLASHSALKAIERHTIYDAYAPRTAPPASSNRAGRIACVGRLTPIKGQDLLVEAMAKLEGAHCVFLGAGEPAYEQRLRQAAAGSPAIEWRGFVADVRPVLDESAVLACPSHREPLGRVILEGWDAGAVPVVFAGAGGSAELVSASGGGIVYADQTVEGLARALAQALALKRSESERLVERGRAWVREHCDPVHYANTMATIWRGACRPAPEPGP